jgi:hypothetical protein
MIAAVSKSRETGQDLQTATNKVNQTTGEF